MQRVCVARLWDHGERKGKMPSQGLAALGPTVLAPSSVWRQFHQRPRVTGHPAKLLLTSGPTETVSDNDCCFKLPHFGVTSYRAVGNWEKREGHLCAEVIFEAKSFKPWPLDMQREVMEKDSLCVNKSPIQLWFRAPQCSGSMEAPRYSIQWRAQGMWRHLPWTSIYTASTVLLCWLHWLGVVTTAVGREVLASQRYSLLIPTLPSMLE